MPALARTGRPPTSELEHKKANGRDRPRLNDAGGDAGAGILGAAFVDRHDLRLALRGEIGAEPDSFAENGDMILLEGATTAIFGPSGSAATGRVARRLIASRAVRAADFFMAATLARNARHASHAVVLYRPPPVEGA